MLRYVQDFLQKNKMKKYRYELPSETLANDCPYFAIAITSANRHQKGGTVHVNKEDFGIPYIKTIWKGHHWRNISKTDIVNESHYIKDNQKWYFSHGAQRKAWHLKRKGVRIKDDMITIATGRAGQRPFERKEEMGLMVQMLKDFKGSFDHAFWEGYNYVPMDESFRRALANHKPR